MTKNTVILFLVVAFAITAFRFPASFLYSYSNSGDLYLYSVIGNSWKAGVLPYSGVFDIKGPAFYGLWLIFSWLGGYSFIPALIFLMLCYTAALVISYKISRIYLSVPWAILCATVFVTFIASALENPSQIGGGAGGFSPEELSVPIVLYLIFVFLNPVTRHRKGRVSPYLILGLGCGWMFWAKFTMVTPFIVLATFLLYKVFVKSSSAKLKQLVWFLVGVVSISILVIGTFILQGNLEPMLKTYFLSKTPTIFSPSVGVQGLITGTGSRVPMLQELQAMGNYLLFNVLLGKPYLIVIITLFIVSLFKFPNRINIRSKIHNYPNSKSSKKYITWSFATSLIVAITLSRHLYQLFIPSCFLIFGFIIVLSFLSKKTQPFNGTRFVKLFSLALSLILPFIIIFTIYQPGNLSKRDFLGHEQSFATTFANYIKTRTVNSPSISSTGSVGPNSPIIIGYSSTDQSAQIIYNLQLVPSQPYIFFDPNTGVDLSIRENLINSKVPDYIIAYDDQIPENYTKVLTVNQEGINYNLYSKD
jgi:hypothetical protein